jgi:hypothetical protein
MAVLAKQASLAMHPIQLMAAMLITKDAQPTYGKDLLIQA